MTMWIESRSPMIVRDTSRPAFDVTLAFRSPPEPPRAGGDFAEITEREDGSTTFIVGDASAKRDVGRRHAAFLLACYRSATALSREPRAIVAAMNDDYCRFLQFELDMGYFASAIIGTLFQSGLLTYAGAGAPPALLFGGDANHEHLQPTGGVLGISTRTLCGDRSIRLLNGDALLVFTDGITESRSRVSPQESFGSRGLARIGWDHLQRGRRLCASMILDGVARAGFAFRDDATVMCCIASDLH